MRFIAISLWVISGIAVVAMIVFLAHGRERSWERMAGSPDRGPVDLLTLPRSRTANDALAGTAGLRGDADIVLPAYDETADRLLEQVAGNIERADPLAHRVDDGSDPRQLRYVTYSPIMRFPDLVVIQTMDREDGTAGLLIYAAAQLGRRDFGANLRRVQSYLPAP